MEFQIPLHINFIDFKKAFDSVHKDSLSDIARLYGIPDKYINIFKNLYLNSICYIKTEKGATEPFDIIPGARQGCILSPLLFLLLIDYVMHQAMAKPYFGILWQN